MISHNEVAVLPITNLIYSLDNKDCPRVILFRRKRKTYQVLTNRRWRALSSHTWLELLFRDGGNIRAVNAQALPLHLLSFHSDSPKGRG